MGLSMFLEELEYCRIIEPVIEVVSSVTASFIFCSDVFLLGLLHVANVASFYIDTSCSNLWIWRNGFKILNYFIMSKISSNTRISCGLVPNPYI